MSRYKIAARKAVNKRMDNVFKRIHYTKRRELASLLYQLQAARLAIREFDKQTILATEIRRTTLESYLRNGDKNYLSCYIILHYIRKEGTPLDVQAMDLTEQYGIEYTPQDLIDFIHEYPCGSSTYPKLQEIRTIRESIKSITGFRATKQFIQYLNSKLKVNNNTIKTPF